jgi:hypothetical protein
MSKTDFELFKGTSFSDLMQDIYQNSKKKERQINTLIQELRPMVKNLGDATVIVPLIKEYLEVSVKNDEHLVKLAAVVQRLVSATTRASNEEGGNELLITEEEKQQLLREAEAALEKIEEEANK